MLHNIAELIRALRKKEEQIIAASGIKHAPTIGAQYEGLTSSLLGCMLPPGLGLQVVSGFVEGIDHQLSGQIDCMLVCGSGTAVPHTSLFKWSIKSVLAIFEVKKTLFSSDLADAHDQLNEVLEQFWEHAATDRLDQTTDLSSAAYVYGQIVGEPAPMIDDEGEMPIHKQFVYHTLIAEQLAPLRVILGYGGFKTEYTLRQGFVAFVEKRTQIGGLRAGSLPSLVIAGESCILRLNGHPYYMPLRNDYWLAYASSDLNPMVFLLNLVMTKLSYLFGAPAWFAMDMAEETYTPLLWVKAVEKEGEKAWLYTHQKVSSAALKREAAPEVFEWQPLRIQDLQFVILNMIGDKGLTEEDLKTVARDFDPNELHPQVTELIKHRFLAWKEGRLVFLTRQCTTAFVPGFGAVAGDGQDPRFLRWIELQDHRRRRM